MKLDENIFEVLVTVSVLKRTVSISAVAVARVKLEGNRHRCVCSALQNGDDCKELKPLLFPESSAR